MSSTLPIRPLGARRFYNRLAIGLSLLAGAIAVILLLIILVSVTAVGGQAFSWDFFTEPMKPYGIPNAGIANAILGTFLITLGSVVIGGPLGVLGGIFLSEYARETKLGSVIRFCGNIMMGIPSIIVGLFVYALVVVPMGGSSGLAGSLALTVIMLPVIMRTTEDMLGLVPNALREAALATGMPRWRATVSIVFRAAKSGLLTGILLAIARVSGETAPLLFTALWSNSWPIEFDGGIESTYFDGPTANLTVTVTNYAMNSPYPEMVERAWGAALVITIAVLSINIFARTVIRQKH